MPGLGRWVPSPLGLSPGRAGTSLGEGSPVKGAGPAGDVREGEPPLEGLRGEPAGAPGTEAGETRTEARRGLPGGRRSCSWGLSHQLGGDGQGGGRGAYGLSGGGRGRGTRGRTRGKQGQVQEPKPSASDV